MAALATTVALAVTTSQVRQGRTNRPRHRKIAARHCAHIGCRMRVFCAACWCLRKVADISSTVRCCSGGAELSWPLMQTNVEPGRLVSLLAVQTDAAHGHACAWWTRIDGRLSAQRPRSTYTELMNSSGLRASITHLSMVYTKIGRPVASCKLRAPRGCVRKMSA